MKKSALFVFLVSLAAVGAFAGSTSIQLKAPHVDALTVSISGYGNYSLSGTELSTINDNLDSGFLTIQNQLNDDTFSKLSNLTDLPKGFANANAATFDNASLLGYQTYDLFAVMLGFDLGLAVPSLDPNGAIAAVNDIANTGDVYAGAATGGFGAQVGVNLGWWVPNLYGTVKFGFVPSLDVGGVGFQQTMFGLGANYTLVPQYEFAAGLFKWRGVSVGTGFVYNASSTNVTVKVADQSTATYSTTVTASGHSTTLNYSASATDITAKLKVDNSSFVIPFDVMSSVQLLWFLNLGLDLGVDVAFSGARVKVDGSSGIALTGITGATVTDGSATLTGTDSSNGGDLFLPRIGTSVGLDLAIFKIDVPMSYYPFSKAFSIGMTGGIVW